jgi:transposase
VDLTSIARMKADGHSLRNIAEKLGVGYGTVRMRLAAGERKTSRPKAAARIGMQGVKSPVPASGKQ